MPQLKYVGNKLELFKQNEVMLSFVLNRKINNIYIFNLNIIQRLRRSYRPYKVEIQTQEPKR
jgi:hypothetical protein